MLLEGLCFPFLGGFVKSKKSDVEIMSPLVRLSFRDEKSFVRFITLDMS